MSGNSYGCTPCQDKDSPKKEIHKSITNSSDCEKDSSSKSKNHEGCCHRCGCVSSCSHCSLNLFTASMMQEYSSYASLAKKAKTPYNSSILSDGFYSIWLIPKIG